MSERKKQRGIFEREPGSGAWWIRYADGTGRIRREKAGSRQDAIDLRVKRKAEVLRGRKLPERLRTRKVLFLELAEDAEKYVKANNLGHEVDALRIGRLKEEFGNQTAEIPIEDFRKWFDSQEWSAGTYNRYRTVLSLVYRLGKENKKVSSNPAHLLKHRKEADGRVRFLNQRDPKEEARLRKVIADRFPDHMPELDIALNTGMRRSEQYRRIDWSCVDLPRRDLFIPQSKSGKSRHVRLNNATVAAFQEFRRRTNGTDPIFSSRNHGESLRGPRHWFEAAACEAKLKDFTWHDLRHTFASRLVMTGTDLRTVADLLGHANIQMTMRYAHLAPAHKQAAVDRLNAFNNRKKSDIVKQSEKDPRSEESNDGKPTNVASHATTGIGADPQTGNQTDTRTSTKQKDSFGK